MPKLNIYAKVLPRTYRDGIDSKPSGSLILWTFRGLFFFSENMDMTFGDFVVIYLADMEKRLRESTMISRTIKILQIISEYFILCL